MKPTSATRRLNETPRAANGGAALSARDLVEQSCRVREDFGVLVGAARHTASGWRMLVRDRLARQPYATLAVAVGVGYVLGGGVPTVLVRTLAGLGGRLIVEQTLMLFATDRTR